MKNRNDGYLLIYGNNMEDVAEGKKWIFLYQISFRVYAFHFFIVMEHLKSVSSNIYLLMQQQ